MPIKKKILYPCLGALCLSLIGVTALLSHSPKASEVQADHLHSTAGLYARVTDVSDIHDGDTVIMISDDGHAVRDIGGNPTFLYTRNDSIFVSQDRSLALLDNAYVVPFTVRQGYTAGTFAFYGDYNKNYTNMGGYVSYDRRGSNYDNPGPHDYSGNGAGIGYWYEGCGLRKNKDLKESSFTLTYNEEDGVGHMWIQNVYLKDNQVDGEWKAPNLVWTSSYSDRFGWGWGSNLNIYKQLSVTSVSMVTPPDQTTFTVGDKLDLSGLVVDVHYGNNQHTTLAYDVNPDFFAHTEYVTGTGTVQTIVSILNGGTYGSFNLQITVNSTNGYFYRTTSPIYDGRGKWLLTLDLGTQAEPDVRALRANGDTTALASVTVVDDYINPNITTAIFTVKLIDDQFYLQYIDGSDVYYVHSDGGVGLNLSSTKQSPITFEYSESLHTTLIKNGAGHYLGNGGGYQTIGFNDGTPVTLYHLPCNLGELSGFTASLKSLLSYCSSDGDFDYYATYKTQWDAMASSFAALSDDAQAYLRNLSYNHGAEERDSLEDLIDRYDYILSKYDALDFMGRKTHGAYRQNALSMKGLSFDAKDISFLALTLTFAGVAAASFAAVVYLKKKKANQ